MTRTTGFILGVAAAGLVLVCMCSAVAVLYPLTVAGRAVAQNMVLESPGTGVVAGAIADYELPAGYREQVAMSLFGLSLVAAGPDNSDSHIFLMQFPANAELNQEMMKRQMRDALGRQSYHNYGSQWDSLKVVGYRDVVIRGQTVRMEVSEGVNHDELPYRQMTGIFPSKGGYALLVIAQPISTWDQEAIDTFLASIH